jgi:hypothetical protein
MTTGRDPGRIVIIGGAVIGASIAYHIASNGHRDVAVLERGRLGEGRHIEGDWRHPPAVHLACQRATVPGGRRLFPALPGPSGRALRVPAAWLLPSMMILVDGLLDMQLNSAGVREPSQIARTAFPVDTDMSKADLTSSNSLAEDSARFLARGGT